eukprot:3973929-Pyramimonas_sp.AAC.1
MLTSCLRHAYGDAYVSRAATFCRRKRHPSVGGPYMCIMCCVRPRYAPSRAGARVPARVAFAPRRRRSGADGGVTYARRVYRRG